MVKKPPLSYAPNARVEKNGDVTYITASCGGHVDHLAAPGEKIRVHALHEDTKVSIIADKNGVPVHVEVSGNENAVIALEGRVEISKIDLEENNVIVLLNKEIYRDWKPSPRYCYTPPKPADLAGPATPLDRATVRKLKKFRGHSVPVAPRWGKNGGICLS